MDNHTSRLVGEAYLKSFIPMLDSEGIHPFIIEDYIVGDKFDMAFRAIRKIDNRSLIIKKVVKSVERIGGYPLEYLIVRSLDHPHIGKFHEIREDKEYFYMIGDYYSGGDLDTFIDKYDYDGGDGIGLTKFKDFARQIVSALDYCHCRGIVHSDVKLENIVLDGDHLYLIDFGFATTQELGGMIRVTNGTPMYASPELFREDPFDGFKSDIWALGVTLYVLYFGEYPFCGSNRHYLVRMITEIDPDYSIKATEPDPKVIDLIKLILVKAPSKRLSLSEILVRLL